MEEFWKNLTWPLCFFIFLSVFIVVFKKQIADLLSRKNISIDKNGFKITAPEVQREKTKQESVQELLLAVGDSIVLKDFEDRIRNDLKERNLETEGDSVIVLIKHLAASHLNLEFEQIHSLILGSQISLLKRLNEVKGRGKPRDFIQAYFEEVKRKFQKEIDAWTLDQYLSFLRDRLLITLENDNYHITNMGVEYLTWVMRNGRSEDKNL